MLNGILETKHIDSYL